MESLRLFTWNELRQYDGLGGRPAYISYKGLVYDVTGSEMWPAGRHQNRHSAGDDLTALLPQSPHGEDVILRFPVVGRME
ncbi:MAG: cytochrome B5 [Candidatus Zixiibacteriota bacterium]|nr:MAG: cytochrome B5 [candidate division Zixibacteria bacterium]